MLASENDALRSQGRELRLPWPWHSGLDMNAMMSPLQCAHFTDAGTEPVKGSNGPFTLWKNWDRNPGVLSPHPATSSSAWVQWAVPESTLKTSRLLFINTAWRARVSNLENILLLTKLKPIPTTTPGTSPKNTSSSCKRQQKQCGGAG